jgi:hypothetical protein
LIGDNKGTTALLLLNIQPVWRKDQVTTTASGKEQDMTRIPLIIATVLALAGPASAECYADYKAKQDSPLRLHYGVAQVSDANCSRGKAEAELSGRLASAGWTLLNVLSTFGPEGLGERQASAGDYFLRY